MEKELEKNEGIRLCCESSKGEINAECGAAIKEEENLRREICTLCNSHPDYHFNIPFNIFTDNPVTPSTTTFPSHGMKYLYGMPDCTTHTFNFSDYDWSIYQNGYLNIGNSIYNQTNYCINYGKKLEQGDYN